MRISPSDWDIREGFLEEVVSKLSFEEKAAVFNVKRRGWSGEQGIQLRAPSRQMSST